MNKPIMSRSTNIETRYLKTNQAMIRYSMCRNLLTKTAKEAGALIKIGRAVFIDAQRLGEYMTGFANNPEE